MSETGNERGGRCFISVESVEIGDKILEDLGSDITIGEHANIHLV